MTIENPIDMLTYEHKYILKGVHGLSVIDEELDRDEPADPALRHRIVEFMRNFADACHHAKEEAALFPAMESKGVPRTGCPLGGLRAEHEKGRKLASALGDAADAYADGNSSAVEAIRHAIAGIRQLYPNHIWKEDEMVFPMAQRLFTQDELDKIKTDFDEAESRLGHSLHEYTAFANEMELLHGVPRL
jgi:hemerythrin-like domain-containing protein